LNSNNKNKTNQGNTFIIVIATLSFLAVLATSLLVAVAVCYRMKAYDINSRDNFYYLEQAMDELYAGVGSIAMEHLNEAYNDVTDVIVVYDTDKKTYVTMSNADANAMLDHLFMDKLKADSGLQSTSIASTLEGFLSNPVSANPDGISVSTGNVYTTNDSLTIENVVLKRTAEYSTVNTYKDDSKLADKAKYVQSITTDLVINAPSFSIDFSSINNDPLFDFTLISDMGVQIEGIGTKTFINGNVYAANDFYNKDYNYDTDTNITPYSDGGDNVAYDNNDGLKPASMYSGLYVDKAQVSIVADRLIVPGSIAAMNCADLSIVGSGKDDKTKHSQIWTDNIILGGYARKIGTSNTYRGSDLEMVANAYVSDDMELNASGSKYVLDGNYYGYNNGTTDKRSFSKAYLGKVLSSSKYPISSKADVKLDITDGNYKYKGSTVINLPGQSHYNSSSVVVNGQDSVLDFTDTDSVYIAGQAYVEMSKDTKALAYAIRTSDDAVDVSELEAGQTADDVKNAESNPYTYTDEDADNYSLEKNVAGTAFDKRRVDDYKTGESISVKSNQLAYIPPYYIDESNIGDGEISVAWPELLANQTFKYKDASGVEQTTTFKKLFGEGDEYKNIPVVKTVVGGTNYYFYDFSEIDPYKAAAFIENYAALFSLDPSAVAGTISAGEKSDLFDITDWKHFKVKSITNVDDKKIYTNSAISVKNATSTKLTVKGRKDSIKPLFNVDNDLELGKGFSNSGSASVAQSITVSNDIRERYKKMRLLLTDKPTDVAAASLTPTVSETSITPINTYFDYSGMIDYTGTLPKSGYTIISSTKDVKVTGSGKFMGIVICKGNVTFDSSIKEVHGLIVAGGKIIVKDQDINFIANREIIKAVLDECRRAEKTSVLKNFFKLFKHYYIPDSGDTVADPNIVSVKNVSSVQYEDILGFSNWKKNVD